MNHPDRKDFLSWQPPVSHGKVSVQIIMPLLIVELPAFLRHAAGQYWQYPRSYRQEIAHAAGAAALTNQPVAQDNLLKSWLVYP